MESGSMSDQLEAFHASLIDQGMESCEAPKDWIQAFGLLKRFLKTSADERKVVLFITGRSIARPGYWLEGASSSERHSWEGVAFERVCMWHEREIRMALGISGVSANVCSWRSAQKSGGAQIDMLIDRKDGVINVCEVKFVTGEFSIGAKYALELENKLSVLKEETQTGKSLHLTMITVSGVKRNENSYLVHSQVRLDDFFREYVF